MQNPANNLVNKILLLMRKRIVLFLIFSLWFINSLFLFHWFFKAYTVIALIYLILSLILIFINIKISKNTLPAFLSLSFLFVCLGISVLLNLSSIRFGYLLFEISPLLMIYLFVIKRESIKKIYKQDIYISLYIIMVISSIFTLFFSKGDFSNRAHIIVFPNYVLNSNIYSYPLVLAILIGLYDIIYQKHEKYLIINIFCTILMIIVTIACKSRGALLALFISSLIMLFYASFFSKNKKEKIRARLLIGVSACLIIPFFIYFVIKSDSSFFADSGRFDLWKVALERFKNKPFWGVGNKENYASFLTSHNWFLDILSQFGIFFLFFYIFSFLLLLKPFIKNPLVSLFVFSLIQSFIDCGSMTQITSIIIALVLFDLNAPSTNNLISIDNKIRKVRKCTYE